MGAIMKELGAELQAKHPSVGAVRSIGLFGIYGTGAQPEDAAADGSV